MRENKRFEIKDARNAAMDMTRNRLMVVIMMFGAAFLFLGVRTVDLGLVEDIVEANNFDRAFVPVLPARADVVDRNGAILATNLETASLYANPRQIQEPEVAARQLVRILPDLSEADVLTKLRSNRHFVWLRRKLTPRQQWQINALGIPGFGFQMEEERVYPQGDLASHVLGFVDVDGNGIAGIENFFDARLADPMAANDPLMLSIDVRVQHAIADELSRTVARFSAAGAAGREGRGGRDGAEGLNCHGAVTIWAGMASRPRFGVRGCPRIDAQHQGHTLAPPSERGPLWYRGCPVRAGGETWTTCFESRTQWVPRARGG